MMSGKKLIPTGNVEKSRQRRSRPFAVLTYTVYAPRVKRAAALPVEKGVLAPLGWGGGNNEPFGKTQGMLF